MECAKTTQLPRERYPRPLIFHDGRLAFLPTSSAMLAFFLFLPLGLILSVIRITIGIVLPYKISFAAGAFFGVRFRTSGRCSMGPDAKPRGVLFVCTHRTLVDPLMLTAALQKPVATVTYSLSRLSEILAPIRTVRLTRDRDRDAKTISQLLERGDLAVCPEGTTCREPYLLRFSSLFAELADDMVPVALDAQVTLLYGTTTSGHKWLDPIAFLANPAPSYRVEFLGPVPPDQTCAGGRTGVEVANWVQHRLGDALAPATKFEIPKEDDRGASKRTAIPRACSILEPLSDPLLAIVVHHEQRLEDADGDHRVQLASPGAKLLKNKETRDRG
nr:glycerol-3-phosphate acyltransferase 1-like [Aegilops tauschii subsp. strangulata]